MKEQRVVYWLFYQREKLTTSINAEQHRKILRVGDTPLAEMQGTGNLPILLATDAHGSGVLTNTAHETVVRSFTAYGYEHALNAQDMLLGFNAEPRAKISNNYMLGNGYRSYTPSLFRLGSPDRLSPFRQGGINSYSYCLGDPVNSTDPTGHLTVKNTVARALLKNDPYRRRIVKTYQKHELKTRTRGLTLEEISRTNTTGEDRHSNLSRYENENFHNPYNELSKHQLSLLDSAVTTATDIANKHWSSAEDMELYLESFQFLSEQKGSINSSLPSRRGRDIGIASDKDARLFIAHKMMQHQRSFNKSIREGWIAEPLAQANSQLLNR